MFLRLIFSSRWLKRWKTWKSANGLRPLSEKRLYEQSVQGMRLKIFMTHKRTNCLRHHTKCAIACADCLGRVAISFFVSSDVSANSRVVKIYVEDGLSRSALDRSKCLDVSTNRRVDKMELRDGLSRLHTEHIKLMDVSANSCVQIVDLREVSSGLCVR